jgi:adenylosuccinate lyase
MLKNALEKVYMPLLDDVVSELSGMKHEWSHITMLARTHGQPAVPTKLGKEFGVFIERLEKQYDLLKGLHHYGKMGGAVGNFNAHVAAFPNINWPDFADEFVGNYGLVRLQTTTQIEHYDDIAAIFDNLKRINTILIGLDRDVWTYISMDYFKQKINPEETGSSTMPHKVNPIDWENSEGNLGLANALFEHFSAKLPISRLQRDLSDSTVLRNVGYAMALTVIGLNSIIKGSGKLLINENKIWLDLDKNVVVISEGIQTILRREGFSNSYDVLKELTRKNQEVTLEDIHVFIDSLKISDEIKAELKKITPENYTGIHSDLYSPES